MADTSSSLVSSSPSSSSTVTPATTSFSITQCVTLKLSSSNYLIWKTQFESWLNSQMMIGYVTGTTPRPAPTISVKTGDVLTEAPNPELVKWVRNDQIILAWLFGSLLEEALRSVYGLYSAQDVWLALAKKYNRVSASRRSDLQRRLQNVTKQGKSMEEYLTSVKVICDQLESIGCPVPENDKIFGVLHGLGQEYESIATVIENSMDFDPSPCFEDVVAKLTNFDDKIQTYQSFPMVTPHQAFNTGRGYFNRGRGYGRFYGSNRGRNSYSTRGRGFHQQINNGSSSQKDPRPTCQICHKPGHSAYKCYKRFDHAFQQPEFHDAFAAMRVTDLSNTSGTEWYPDTGATAHITNSTAQLQTSQTYNGQDAVIVGNGDFLPITHVGSANLSSLQGNIPLQDVLVCPGITKSLLSVSKLTSDYPCAFEFDSDGVIVKDKQT